LIQNSGWFNGNFVSQHSFDIEPGTGGIASVSDGLPPDGRRKGPASYLPRDKQLERRIPMVKRIVQILTILSQLLWLFTSTAIAKDIFAIDLHVEYKDGAFNVDARTATRNLNNTTEMLTREVFGFNGFGNRTAFSRENTLKLTIVDRIVFRVRDEKGVRDYLFVSNDVPISVYSKGRVSMSELRGFNRALLEGSPDTGNRVSALKCATGVHLIRLHLEADR
jgi:hypothetical protein